MSAAGHPVTVRRALRRDLPALLELESLFPGDRLSRSSLMRLLLRESADVWVAEVAEAADQVASGQVAGDAIVLYRKGFDAARLYSMVVRPEWRGRGVASALLGAAEQRALQRGLSVMRLEVREDNRGAIAFYAKAGYRETGRSPDYYEDSAGALRMSKPLA